MAQELEVQSPKLPVLLAPLCDKLGVEISWLDTLADGKAFLKYNPSSGHSPQILLPRRAGKTAWARFCAAHELAHFFLIKDHGIVPANDREYWQIEEVCDEFARLILMPDGLVATPFSHTAQSAKDLSKLCAKYAALSKSPWAQVGKRISDFRDGVAYFKLEQNGAGDFLVVSSSLDRYAGRGTKIRPAHADWHLCESISKSSSEHSEPEDWSDRVSLKGKLAKLMSLVEATALVAEQMSGKLPHIRLVASRSANNEQKPSRTSPER